MSESNIAVVFMGDSITHGQYVGPTHRWSSLVAAAVAERYESNGISFSFRNRSVSGETSRQGLLRFPADVQDAQPTLVTIQFGLNDCNCWETDRGYPRVSKGAFAENLREMIHRARHFRAESIVLSTNHCTLRDENDLFGQTFETRNRTYNDIVRRIAQEEAVTLCDIESVFAPLTRETLREYLLPEPDLLHLSREGNAHYARHILPALLSEIDTIIERRQPR